MSTRKMTQDEYDTAMRRLEDQMQSAGTTYREARERSDYAYGMEVEDESTRSTYLQAKRQLDKARREMQNLRANRLRLVEPADRTGEK